MQYLWVHYKSVFVVFTSRAVWGLDAGGGNECVDAAYRRSAAACIHLSCPSLGCEERPIPQTVLASLLSTSIGLSSTKCYVNVWSDDCLKTNLPEDLHLFCKFNFHKILWLFKKVFLKLYMYSRTEELTIYVVIVSALTQCNWNVLFHFAAQQCVDPRTFLVNSSTGH